MTVKPSSPPTCVCHNTLLPLWGLGFWDIFRFLVTDGRTFFGSWSLIDLTHKNTILEEDRGMTVKLSSPPTYCPQPRTNNFFQHPTHYLTTADPYRKNHELQSLNHENQTQTLNPKP